MVAEGQESPHSNTNQNLLSFLFLSNGLFLARPGFSCGKVLISLAKQMKTMMLYLVINFSMIFKTKFNRKRCNCVFDFILSKPNMGLFCFDIFQTW